MVLGIQTVDTGVFGGILLGLLTAFVYDRTCEKAHRGILGGVFSGVRWSFACVAALAAVLGSGACFVWPPIQKAIAAVTGFIAASGNIGLFLYGFLERLLILQGCIIWCICRSSSRSWAVSLWWAASPIPVPMWS